MKHLQYVQSWRSCVLIEMQIVVVWAVCSQTIISRQDGRPPSCRVHQHLSLKIHLGFRHDCLSTRRPPRGYSCAEQWELRAGRAAGTHFWPALLHMFRYVWSNHICHVNPLPTNLSSDVLLLHDTWLFLVLLWSPLVGRFMVGGFRSLSVYLLHDSCCNFSVDRQLYEMSIWSVRIKHGFLWVDI